MAILPQKRRVCKGKGGWPEVEGANVRPWAADASAAIRELLEVRGIVDLLLAFTPDPHAGYRKQSFGFGI